jgi:tRNA G18 (ribose-2'-O)-methylase SpoU
MSEIAVVLPNIRSAHNVGSIFRTADGAGVARVYLAGHTPRPLDRFGRVDKTLSKTALGAEKSMSWEYVHDPARLLNRLKTEGWHLVGVEQDTRASDYRTKRSAGKVAFIFGNEVRGISPKLRGLCDEIVEIPMYGKKESLNVSVAAGIVLFAARQ